MNMNSETENRKVVVKKNGVGEYPSYDMNKSGDYDIQCDNNNDSTLFHTLYLFFKKSEKCSSVR